MSRTKKEKNIREFVTEGNIMWWGDENIKNLLTEIANGATSSFRRGKNSRRYINLPCAFDIETTSFFIKDGKVITQDEMSKLPSKEQKKVDKRAISYIWMFGINGYCIFGRKNEEFVELTKMLREVFGLRKKVRLPVYVHNLSYEFGFYKDYLTWDDVFAMDSHKTCYADSDGIEFRCSYILTGMSLSKISENCNRYPCKKKVGDLDYNLIRTPETELTEKELGYCEMDIRVIMNYIKEQIEIEGSVKDIPLTKTGYVRRHCRERCLDRTDRKSYGEYHRLIKSLSLGTLEYKQLKKAFSGGYTHANPLNAFVTHENVASYDFSSSYPAVMVSMKYPMSKGRRVVVKKQDELDLLLKTKCCLFDITIYNLSAKDDVPDYYISESKCWEKENVFSINGRVKQADKISTTITEVDMEVMRRCYNWEKFTVKNMFVYDKNYLPKQFVDCVLSLYEDKTTLKNVKGKEIEYGLKKELLNSLYGMLVTDINRDEIIYADDWYKAPGDEYEAIENYNNSENRFISYPWGVWVTAYARRAVWSGILAVGQDDHIYTDTDSIKIANREKHIDYIEKYNNYIDNCMKAACDYHGFDFNRTRPKTVNGLEKPLGRWDYEETYTRFKTIGAKRYLVEHSDGSKLLTVSGLDKIEGTKYLTNKYDDAFKAFNLSLKVPYKEDGVEGSSGRLVHCYIEYPMEGDIVDYLGNEYHYNQLSGICLYGTTYSFNSNSGFEDFCNNFREVKK